MPKFVISQATRTVECHVFEASTKEEALQKFNGGERELEYWRYDGAPAKATARAYRASDDEAN